MNNQHLRVLVVEGSPGGSADICAWLTAGGYGCVVTPDVGEAVRAARAAPPDTAIVDLPIAHQGGADLVRRLRRLAPDARVVVMSAAGEFDADLASRLGVDDWLVQPVARGELLRAVEPVGLATKPNISEDVRALYTMLKRCSRKTADRALRVQRVACLMAEDMGLDGALVSSIGCAALLADIGRLGLPGAMADESAWHAPLSRALFETHPEIGHKLIASVDGLGNIAGLVLCAQERFDGTGFPRGLRGQAIPLGSRIVAVADAYETLKRKEHGGVEAGAELAMRAGTSLDPEVVAAWFRVAERRFAPSGTLSI